MIRVNRSLYERLRPIVATSAGQTSSPGTRIIELSRVVTGATWRIGRVGLFREGSQKSAQRVTIAILDTRDFAGFGVFSEFSF